MNFLSLMFFPFLFLLFLVYFLCPGKCQWYVLLAGSLFFYCTWGWQALPFMLASLLASWLAGRAMETEYSLLDQRLKQEKPDRETKRAMQQAAKRRCKYILWIGIAIILGLLIYTKVGKFVQSRMDGFVSEGEVSSFSIIIPLGISYYTLSLIGYLADIYWRKERAESNFFKLALFVLYFPKILQGPISRYKTLGHQLTTAHPFEYKRFCYGLQLMLWGYFKKMVIADRLNLFVTEAFENYSFYSGSILLVAAIFSAFQLYCDFSGCMDIAGGISQVLGIELEKNFDHPFFSASAAEFWRRWHITLGTWFKDYIYMPLVISPRLTKFAGTARKKLGKRAGKAVLSVVPLAVVWILTGLWHGTGANYMIWGLYWGCIIIISNVFGPELKRLPVFLHINTDTKAYRMFQQLRTFGLFIITRIITVPQSLEESGVIFRKIFTEMNLWDLFDGTLCTVALDTPEFILSIVTLVVLWRISCWQQNGSVRDRIASNQILVRWCIYYAAFFAVLILGIYGAGYDASAFVYMNY